MAVCYTVISSYSIDGRHLLVRYIFIFIIFDVQIVYIIEIQDYQLNDVLCCLFGHVHPGLYSTMVL